MVTVFLSYAEADTPIADLVEEILKAHNVNVSRYTNVGYRESFISYMNSLSEHDFVFCIISDSYLKSQACMYEAGIMLKMTDLPRRMIWVVLDDCDKKYYEGTKYSLNISSIYGSETRRLQYSEYWKTQRDELEKTIKAIDNLSGTHLSTQKLNEITEITNTVIPQLLYILADKRGCNFDSIYKNGFREVFDAIADEFVSKEMNSNLESYNILHLQVDNDYYVYDTHVVYIKTCKSIVLHGGMNKLHNRITWFADEDVDITAVSNNITIERLNLHDTNINYNVVFNDDLRQFEEIEFSIQAILQNRHRHFQNFFSTEVISPLRSLNVHLNIENSNTKKIYTQKIVTNIMNENTEESQEHPYQTPYHWHVEKPEVHCEYKIYWE